MNSRHDNARLRASRSRAFTILELLVAVSVMTLVIYVLYALFNQTQMALRKNASQVDVNEGGRAAMEMIVRELSQMEVSGYPAITDLQTKLTYSGSKSFFSRVTPGESVALRLAYQSDAMPPEGDAWAIEQGFRTNILQDFTFTSRGDSGFHVTSYRVIDVDTASARSPGTAPTARCESPRLAKRCSTRPRFSTVFTSSRSPTLPPKRLSRSPTG